MNHSLHYFINCGTQSHNTYDNQYKNILQISRTMKHAHFVPSISGKVALRRKALCKPGRLCSCQLRLLPSTRCCHRGHNMHNRQQCDDQTIQQPVPTHKRKNKIRCPPCKRSEEENHANFLRAGLHQHRFKQFDPLKQPA